jgi:hypothetical protein
VAAALSRGRAASPCPTRRIDSSVPPFSGEAIIARPADIFNLSLRSIPTIGK